MDSKDSKGSMPKVRNSKILHLTHEYVDAVGMLRKKSRPHSKAETISKLTIHLEIIYIFERKKFLMQKL